MVVKRENDTEKREVIVIRSLRKLRGKRDSKGGRGEKKKEEEEELEEEGGGYNNVKRCRCSGSSYVV